MTLWNAKCERPMPGMELQRLRGMTAFQIENSNEEAWEAFEKRTNWCEIFSSICRFIFKRNSNLLDFDICLHGYRAKRKKKNLTYPQPNPAQLNFWTESLFVRCWNVKDSKQRSTVIIYLQFLQTFIIFLKG